MKDLNMQNSLTRRGFISGLAPAGALTCLGSRSLPGMGKPEVTHAAKHKFDAEIKMKPQICFSIEINEGI